MRPYSVSESLTGQYPNQKTVYCVVDARSMDVTPLTESVREAAEWCERLNDAYESGRSDAVRLAPGGLSL